MICIAPNCSAFSLNSNLFRDLISLTLSQITKTQVSFQNFESSFSPKMKFKLGNVEFRKKDKVILSARTLYLEPSPMFLLSWRKTPSSKAFMNFSLEDGKTKKIDFRKAEGTLRANSETIRLESTKILSAKSEILISGDYQKVLKAFNGTIVTKQFALASFKEAGLSGTVDLDANILGYVSQEKKIIPMSGNGKILAQNGTIKNPSITNLFEKALELTNQRALLPPVWDFKTISGNFSITEGVLQSNDLKLKSDPIGLRGRGNLNFLTKSFNLKFQTEKKLGAYHKNGFDLRGTYK